MQKPKKPDIAANSKKFRKGKYELTNSTLNSNEFTQP
jgi:hypothetical protein